MVKTVLGTIYQARDRRLRKLGYTSYDNYRRCEEWRQIKILAVKAGLYDKCCICRKTEKIALHHINYLYLGRVTLEGLWPVCNRHHAKIHMYAKSQDCTIEEASDYVRYGSPELKDFNYLGVHKKKKKVKNFKSQLVLNNSPGPLMDRWLEVKAARFL